MNLLHDHESQGSGVSVELTTCNSNSNEDEVSLQHNIPNSASKRANTLPANKDVTISFPRGEYE